MKRYKSTVVPIWRGKKRPEHSERATMTGADLRSARKRLKLSQEEFGRFLALPPACYHKLTIYAWEKGRRKIPPAVELLVHILTKKSSVE
jgi:DNA-binding transcriptional regulator YiaG